MRYIYIDTKGTLEVRDEPALSLARTQELIGGYVEVIYITHSGFGNQVHVMDHEEGYVRDLPPSVRFPRVYSYDNVLRGPVLIIGINAQGVQRSLTERELAAVRLVPNETDPYPTLQVD